MNFPHEQMTRLNEVRRTDGLDIISPNPYPYPNMASVWIVGNEVWDRATRLDGNHIQCFDLGGVWIVRNEAYARDIDIYSYHIRCI